MPKDTYKIASPETGGVILVPSELEVTTEPPAQQTGWYCHEVVGAEVYKTSAPDTLLTREDDLQPGDEILVTTLVGVYKMTVVRDEEGDLWGDVGETLALLQFNADSRHCWSSACAINKAALSRL